MTDIDWFEWDRRALPYPTVHVDTGPLTRPKLGSWVLKAASLQGSHPSFPFIREAALAFAKTLPPGGIIPYFYTR